MWLKGLHFFQLSPVDRPPDVGNGLTMNNGKSGTVDDGLNAPTMENAIYVRCAGFRCLAYRDLEGKWRNFFTLELLPGNVEELSESRSQFSKPV